MIIDRELRRLADADPAVGLDPAPSEDLLAQLLTEPRSAGRGTRVRRARRLALRPAISLAAVAVLVVVVLLASPSGPVRTTAPGSLALAAQAYANTSATSHEIVHTLARFERTENGTLQNGTIEEWHRGDETHRIETYYSANGDVTAALDHVIDADGVMRQVTEDGSYRIIRASDNEDAANVIAQEQSGFIEQFRQAYERGQLDSTGDAPFAGRPARRYVVSADQNTPKTVVMNGKTVPAPAGLPAGPQQVFYIDRDTAQPLGYTSTMHMNISSGQGGSTPTTLRYVEAVKTIEQLAATPENLAKLRTLSLKRRRDADGCIRGPVTDAHNSDTASKTDCGGTPGAVVGP